MGQRLARNIGAVPAIGEVLGVENAFAPTGVYFEMVIGREGGDILGAETSAIGVAIADNVGEVGRWGFRFGQDDRNSIGRYYALLAEVGHIESIDIASRGTVDIHVGIG